MEAVDERSMLNWYMASIEGNWFVQKKANFPLLEEMSFDFSSSTLKTSVSMCSKFSKCIQMGRSTVEFQMRAHGLEAFERRAKGQDAVNVDLGFNRVLAGDVD